jgi:hypothetical protein
MTLAVRIFEAMICGAIFETKPFETVISGTKIFEAMTFEAKTFGGKTCQARLPGRTTGDARIAGPKLVEPQDREAELDPRAPHPSRRIATSR